MCGLFGGLGDLTGNERNVLKHLFIFTQLRGEDSSGFATLTYEHSKSKYYYSLAKSTSSPVELMESKEGKSALNGNIKAMIGHCRAATVGQVRWVNAHPFHCGHIIGAHNGTLRNKHDLKGHTAFDTDSEALFSTISEKGLEETLPMVEGAYALTYLDINAITLNLIRNKERPLFVAFSKNMKSMYWASEEWMLRIAMSRSGVQIYDNRVEEIPVDTLYTFQIPKSLVELTPPEVAAIEGKKSYTHTDWRRTTNTAGSSGEAGSARIVPNSGEEGKLISFRFTGKIKTNVAGTEYVQGYTDDGIECRIHVHPQRPSPILDAYGSEVFRDCLAQGTVSKLYYVGPVRAYSVRPDSISILSTLQLPSPNESSKQEEQKSEKKSPGSYLRGPGGQFIKEEDHRRYIEQGCGWCGDVPNQEDVDKVTWLAGSNQYVCHHCQSDFEESVGGSRSCC